MRRLVAVLLLLSASAVADEPDWYDVEMIVFERTDGAMGLNERWPYDPGFPDLSEGVELSSFTAVAGDATTST